MTRLEILRAIVNLADWVGDNPTILNVPTPHLTWIVGTRRAQVGQTFEDPTAMSVRLSSDEDPAEDATVDVQNLAQVAARIRDHLRIVRVCQRCGADEFRINGFCSVACEDAHAAFLEGFDDGETSERCKIVAWLRQKAEREPGLQSATWTWNAIADHIERRGDE